MILSGCPCIKYSWEKDCEVCSITGKPTGISLTCDFDFDTDCSIYKKQQSPKPKEKKCRAAL